MGKVTQNKRMKNYYRIFEQIYESPLISITDISANTGLSRNTVAKYLKEMYTCHILIGPCIRMKPAPNYREYVYLMNFRDPWKFYKGLKGFPHVIYRAMTFGDWNTMVITNRLLDFSQLMGFQEMVKLGTRYYSYTHKARYRTWDESFKKIYELLSNAPVPSECKRPSPPLDWGSDQWKLYHTFNFIRKKITPELRKINVRYETYAQWMKSLEDHCTIHTGVYPEGYRNYLSYCFLFFTDHRESVKSVFSLFPATSSIMEVDKQLLILVHVISSKVERRLICLLYDMKAIQMIKGYRHAVALFHSRTLKRKI
ncbi:MAG: winged helix-turn-helix domain-containing protein [Theionarchaea archaeon]|nr:winged helix-turn-helix domain-containing protein [Theionarchaea archaeon]